MADKNRITKNLFRQKSKFSVISILLVSVSPVACLINGKPLVSSLVPTAQSVAINAAGITISGENLNQTDTFSIDKITQPFSFITPSAARLIATPLSPLVFTAGSTYNLLVTNAVASTSIPISIDLTNFTSSSYMTFSPLVGEAMRIDATGNVGIGTSAPGALLNLFSSSKTTPRLLLSGQEFYQSNNTSTNGISILLGVNRTGNRQLWIADSALTTSSSTFSVLRFAPNSRTIDAIATDGVTAQQLILGNTSAGISMNGNVGIGTTNPGTALQLGVTSMGTVPAATNLMIHPTSSTNGAITPVSRIHMTVNGDGGYGSYIGPAWLTGGGSIATVIGSREVAIDYPALYLNKGNVGIGTTTPNFTLDVSGGIQSNSALTITNPTTSSYFILASLLAPNLRAGDSATISLGGAETDSNDAQITYTHVAAGSTSNYGSLQMNSHGGILNWTAGGNVGIGTTTPTNRLYVSQATIGLGETIYGNSPSYQLKDTSSYTGYIGLATAATNYSASSTAGDIVISSGQGRILVSAGGGNGVFLPNASSAWSTYSDRRLKRNIEPISDSLNKVLKLNGYTYNYKTDALGAPLKAGVMAQEVQKALPEAVNKDAHGMLGVEYTALIPLIINSLKEFYHAWVSDSAAVHAELISKDRRIQSLESENSALKTAHCRHFHDDPECTSL